MRLFTRTLYAAFAIYVLWQYVTNHLATPGSHLSRASSQDIARTIGMIAGLAAFSALCGSLWSKLGRTHALGFLSTKLARLFLITGLGCSALCVIFGASVLPDLMLFLGVAAGVTVYFASHAAFGVRLLQKGPVFGGALGKDKGNELVFGWLLGMGLHAVALFSICTFMVPPLPAALAIVTLMAWGGRNELASYARGLLAQSSANTREKPIASTAAWWGAFGAVAFGVAFLNDSRIASPPWAFDAMHVHLASAKSYLVSGGMTFIPQLKSSFQIPLFQWQFTSLLAIFGELGPKLLEGAYFLALSLTTYSLTRRTVPTASTQAACFAALFVSATPIIMYLAGMCYLGLPATVYLTATLICVLIGVDLLKRSPESGQSFGALLGAFLAFVFLSKVQAWGVALPVSMLACAAIFGMPSKQKLNNARRFVVRAGLTAILLALPLLIRNALAMGNPLWPFLGGIFGHDDDIMSHEEIRKLTASIGRLGMGHTFWDFVALPYRLIVHENQFQAERWIGFGVAWLLAVPAIATGLFRKSLWWAIPFVLSFTIPWFFVTQELRYLIYVLPVAAALAVSGLERMHLHGRRFYGVIAGVVLISCVLQTGGWQPEKNTLALQGGQREEFLKRRVAGYKALKWLTQHTDEQTRIYSQNLTGSKYYFHQPANVLGQQDGKFRHSSLMTEDGMSSFRPATEVVSALEEFNVSYVAIRNKGKHYVPSLRLESDPVLAQHLRIATILDGVFIYEFHREGTLSPQSISFGEVNFVQDAEFSNTMHLSWTAVGGDSVQPDAARSQTLLKQGGGLKQRIPVSTSYQGALYALEIEAMAKQAEGAELRLQIVWLPEGGYEATDPNGASLVSADSVQISPSSDGFERLSLLAPQPEHAVRAVISFVNKGKGDIQVKNPALRSLKIQ